MPIYLIDPVTMRGQGPFSEKTEAAEAADSENADTLVVFIGDDGSVESVGELDSLDIEE